VAVTLEMIKVKDNMTNVMHKFVTYLSIYFCVACFGLSFSPSSEAGVQPRQWFKSPRYGVSAQALKPYGTVDYQIKSINSKKKENLCVIGVSHVK
jgi:hypothetical protein